MSEHRYEFIASHLRDQITSGKLSAGARLPTQAALGKQFAASRIVVRQALDILEAEGLIDRLQGGGTFVRRYEPLIRRSSLHYKSDPGAPFAEEALASNRIPRYTHETYPDLATEDIAKRLAIAAGDRVMRTDYVSLANDEPMMAVHSYEPLAITEGTTIERPEKGPKMGAGLVDRFTSIGRRPTAVVEQVVSRIPRPSESAELALRPGTPIVAITRITYENQSPLETADILLDAHRYILEYALKVDPE